MNTEQKAKAYDEAIERAKKVLLDCTPEEQKVVEYIIPELEESEDERIRKEIMYHIQHCDDTIDKETEEMMIAWLEKQGEQKLVEAIEPKFKVGDWITDNTSTFQIVRVENEWYYADDGDKICFDVAHQYYHLWSIQDAKDGDALATKDAVFIFKHLDKTGLSLCKSYCEVICNSDLGLGFDFSINGVYPATEEQRDQLFAKMLEAGYEWDSEKKELRKIEQTPVEWNEKDMGYIDDLIAHFSQNEKLENTKEDIIAWLKSLKNRNTSQLNKERNEEDSIKMQRIIDFLWYNRKGDTDTIYQQEKDIEWLKSLKDRYTWKPSKMQIQSVKDCALNKNIDAGTRIALDSLYQQLLKLKG